MCSKNTYVVFFVECSLNKLKYSVQVEKIICKHNFPSVCLDSETHDNSRVKARNKSILVPKCLHSQCKEFIKFCTH